MTRAPETLTRRALNRALLARQMLLRRTSLDAEQAVEHLLGLQSQIPDNPYVALWSRLDGFDPHALSALTEQRKLVRIALMRGTLHLVSVRDAVALRPVMQKVFERNMTAGSVYGKALTDIDMEALIRAGRQAIEEKPRSNKALEAILEPMFPDRDGHALSQAVRAALPLVQVTPRGLWRRGGLAISTTLESWTGVGLAENDTPDATLLRYLAAFGPASVADMQAWSGLTRLAGAVARLRPQLVEFRDEDGHVLYDLPDAPRPDAETAAPPRFLPDYDNALLGHDDRRRVIDDAHRLHFKKVNGLLPAFLVDGRVAGCWLLDRDKSGARLAITPLVALQRREREALAEEAEALLAFHEPDAPARDIHFVDAR
ncbi:winged helix DNA-binding domain-containing protein [Kaistia adipata]|uniref:winged helix DNA-binding domain-containing protein n=1 Tax=Kaistia adipata TaxID=166954 RepID=UPI0004129897|nr:winged helix DNA-binding domain-containing protein [Kaistia adipata]